VGRLIEVNLVAVGGRWRCSCGWPGDVIGVIFMLMSGAGGGALPLPFYWLIRRGWQESLEESLEESLGESLEENSQKCRKNPQRIIKESAMNLTEFPSNLQIYKRIRRESPKHLKVSLKI